MDYRILWVLLGLTLVTTLYSVGLQRIQHLYSPDWIWVTVVGGNAIIGGAYAVLCGIGVLPWLAFWLLLAVNIAAGVPVIAWQVGQAAGRHAQRSTFRPANGNAAHDTTSATRGAAADRPAAGRPRGS